VDDPGPEDASDERILVTLGEPVSGAEDFSTGRKNGSSIHELSAGGGTAGRAGAGGADEGAGVAERGGLLKNWVKLPSAAAESETPGVEKPLAGGVLGEAGREGGRPEKGPGRGVSSGARGGGVCEGVTPETKMRVNSPGSWAAGGCAGPLTTCVGTCAWASLGGPGAAGRGFNELNICVNSPGAADGPEAGGAAGTAGCAGI
jgi:hypothetical protein